MTDLSISSVPEEMYEEIRHRSGSSGRSLSGEVLFLLRKALDFEQSTQLRRQRIVAEIDDLERSLEPDFLRFV